MPDRALNVETSSVLEWKRTGFFVHPCELMSLSPVAQNPASPRSGNTSSVYPLALVLLVELALVLWAGRYSDLAGPGNPAPFVGVMLAAGLAYLVALALYERVPSWTRPVFFWTAAVLLRLAALPMTPGDDFWRYLWEAKVWLAGHNPYLVSPDAMDLVSLRDSTWPIINHPEYAAIYPPGAELIMAGIAKISPSVLFFKSVFAFADLGVLYLLLRINTGFHRYRTTAWYAWSPAVILAFSGAGHFDSLMLLLMVGAIWALYRSDPLDKQPPAWTWAIISAILLGASISIKIIPLFLVPVWLLMLRKRSVVLILTLLIPWALTYVFGGPGVVLSSLRRFADVTRFNDLFWWTYEGFAGPADNNRLYTYVLCAVSIGLAIYFRKQWRRAMLWVMGAMLILSPVLHPWYVVWILPVASWRQCYPWFILALSSFNALLVWEAGPFWEPWLMTWPLRLMVIVPPLLAVLWWYWILPRWIRPAESAPQ